MTWATLSLIPILMLGVWLSYFLRIRLLPAIAVSLLANAVSAVTLTGLYNAPAHGFGFHPTIGYRLHQNEAPLLVACVLIAANIAIAMVAKLYRAAILRKATAAECEVGTAGVRAWLSPLNIISAACFGFAAAYALDINFFGVLFLTICLLLAFPLCNTLLNQPSSPPAPSQAPAEERQRVLALVEAGKITAEEGAELLSALAQSQVAGVEASGNISGPRRLMIAGAAMVLVGFFLPWFTIHVTQAMHDEMTNIHMEFPLGQKFLQTTLNGGSMQNGLGWIALAAVVGTAGLPLLWTSRSANIIQLRRVTLAALAVGSVVMLYVLSDHFNSMTTIEPGFMLAIGGYAVLWIGAIREYVVHRSVLPIAKAATV